MIGAHDVYSETNPAFCTYALTAFVTAHVSTRPEGPELPIVYLALPIALSGDLSTTFEGTNKNTGLLEWLERSPQVQIGLAERLNASLEIVSDGVRFACFTRVLVLNECARLELGRRKLMKSAIGRLSEESSQMVKRAERLGYWFASIRSTRSAFDMMGLSA